MEIMEVKSRSTASTRGIYCISLTILYFNEAVTVLYHNEKQCKGGMDIRLHDQCQLNISHKSEENTFI